MKNEKQEMTDNELLEDFLNGNEKSFEELIKRHEKPLYQFIIKRIGNHADADDVCQESFIKIYKNAHQFQGLCPFKSWLYKISMNECKMHWKRNKTGINRIIDRDADLESLDLSTDDSGFNICLKEEENTMIQQCIKRLPEKQKITIELKYFHEFKYNEISKIVDRPMGTVKANCNHALISLRKLMAGKDYT